MLAQLFSPAHAAAPISRTLWRRRMSATYEAAARLWLFSAMVCFGTIFVVFQKRTPSISRPWSCRRCICAGMVFRPQSSARMVRLGLGCCLLAVLGSCCSHAPRQPKKSCSVSTHRRAFQRCQRQQTKKINPHDGGQGAEGQGVRKPGDATLGPCRSWTTRAGGNTNWGS